jgi:hypothetical protein
MREWPGLGELVATVNASLTVGFSHANYSDHIYVRRPRLHFNRSSISKREPTVTRAVTVTTSYSSTFSRTTRTNSSIESQS